MAWTLTDHLDEYAAAAGGFLRSQPVLNTVHLTVIETQQRGTLPFGRNDPLFGCGALAAARSRRPCCTRRRFRSC
jgi:ferric iron reductase protein FhuF